MLCVRCFVVLAPRGPVNDVYTPATVSPQGSTSSVGCLAEFAQFADGAWWLPTQGNTNAPAVTPAVASFAECVAQCTATSKCQYVTYDYANNECRTRLAANAVLAG
jgi:hypothetical protein